MSDDQDRANLRGGAWLIADISLNIWALTIVKWLGGGYPATQVVFLRAVVGLCLIAPLAWRDRGRFRALPDLPLHLLRVVLSAVTLSASFYALPRVPFAVFTAIGFTRPIVTMMMAAGFLGETIGRRRWLAAGIAFCGILVAVNPRDVGWSWGLAALAVVVFSGSGAVIATRRLRDAPSIVLMAFYTGGLALFAAPFALSSWVPPAPGHLLPLIAVGCFAQAAQLCFLRAHYHGAAGVLSVLSYLSLVLSVGVGYLVFGEVPAPSFAVGAALIVGAALWVTVDPRSLRLRS